MSTAARNLAAAPLAMWIDGQPAAAVEALDRGLHYGDGLFETIACRHARPRFLDLHLERLEAGCTRLGLPLSALVPLSAQIRALAATREDGTIKLILTRGSATARGYAVRGDEQPRSVLLQYAAPAEDLGAWAAGVVVRMAQGRIGENPALAGIKHLNRLEQVLIRAEWTDPDIREALVFSSSGWLVSGTMSNVFLVKDAQIMTPAITVAGIRGVMRRVVLAQARAAGHVVIETQLNGADVAAAEEMFLTNALIGIWPVRTLEARVLGVGAVTRELQQRLRAVLDAAHA